MVWRFSWHQLGWLYQAYIITRCVFNRLFLLSSDNNDFMIVCVIELNFYHMAAF